MRTVAGTPLVAAARENTAWRSRGPCRQLFQSAAWACGAATSASPPVMSAAAAVAAPHLFLCAIDERPLFRESGRGVPDHGPANRDEPLLVKTYRLPTRGRAAANFDGRTRRSIPTLGG